MVHTLVLSILAFAVVCVAGHYDESEYVLNLLGQSFRYKYKTQDTVSIELYYESLCPDCVAEYPEVQTVVSKLGSYIDLHTFPYGNAKMHVENGTTIITCQHGEPECYGNKLHACAIDFLKETPAYVAFCGCMMQQGSNDNAADQCGKILHVQSNPIKQCAKGKRGHDLLKYYGEKSGKVSYSGVPYVRVNGKDKPEDKPLWDAVCKAFANPPKECNKY